MYAICFLLQISSIVLEIHPSLAKKKKKKKRLNVASPAEPPLCAGWTNKRASLRLVHAPPHPSIRIQTNRIHPSIHPSIPRHHHRSVPTPTIGRRSSETNPILRLARRIRLSASARRDSTHPFIRSSTRTPSVRPRRRRRPSVRLSVGERINRHHHPRTRASSVAHKERKKDPSIHHEIRFRCKAPSRLSLESSIHPIIHPSIHHRSESRGAYRSIHIYTRTYLPLVVAPALIVVGIVTTLIAYARVSQSNQSNASTALCFSTESNRIESDAHPGVYSSSMRCDAMRSRKFARPQSRTPRAVVVGDHVSFRLID